MLHYAPDTGAWTWLVRSNGRVPAGSPAVSRGVRYIAIKIDGRSHPAHRLAVLYMTGAWPDEEVVHRDGDGFNNRWDNIRPATRSQNCANRKLFKNNTSGYRGVIRHEGRWAAQIRVNGKNRRIGVFDDLATAAKAYEAAALAAFGEYRRDG